MGVGGGGVKSPVLYSCVYVLPWPGARHGEQRDRDGSRRLLRAYVIQRQSVQPLRSCPEGGFTGGKERSLSTPFLWPALQFSLSGRFGVSSWSDWFMLSRCAQCEAFVFCLSRCARAGKRALAKAGGWGGGLSLQPRESGESPQSGRCAGITELGGLGRSLWVAQFNLLILQPKTPRPRGV